MSSTSSEISGAAQSANDTVNTVQAAPQSANALASLAALTPKHPFTKNASSPQRLAPAPSVFALRI
jgi:hypothetical protein